MRVTHYEINVIYVIIAIYFRRSENILTVSRLSSIVRLLRYITCDLHANTYYVHVKISFTNNISNDLVYKLRASS